MAAIKETFIICDIPRCENTFGVDDRLYTAMQHRRNYLNSGWHFWNGKDICPECWNNNRYRENELTNSNK